MVPALPDALRSRLAAWRRAALGVVPDRRRLLPDRLRALPERSPRRLLLGDPDAAREHLRVAAGLAGTGAVLTVLVGSLGIVVSPAVWDALIPPGLAGLAVLAAANAYWRGGPLVGYALVFGPLAAGAAGAAAGDSVGVGFEAVGVVLGLALAVPVLHGSGLAARRLRGWAR